MATHRIVTRRFARCKGIRLELHSPCSVRTGWWDVSVEGTRYKVEVCRIFGGSPKYNSKKWTMWWRIPNLLDETHRWKHYTIQQTELLQMNRIWCVVASMEYDSWVSPTSGRGWQPDWQLYMTIYYDLNNEWKLTGGDIK